MANDDEGYWDKSDVSNKTNFFEGNTVSGQLKPVDWSANPTEPKPAIIQSDVTKQPNRFDVNTSVAGQAQSFNAVDWSGKPVESKPAAAQPSLPKQPAEVAAKLVNSSIPLQRFNQDHLAHSVSTPAIAPLSKLFSTASLTEPKRKAASSEETVSNILFHREFCLEQYRSLSDKESLLKQALKSGSGDALLCVLLFLKRSLKSDIFVSVLKKYPKASRAFVNYLTMRGKDAEALQLSIELRESTLMVDCVLQRAEVEFKSGDAKAASDCEKCLQILSSLIELACGKNQSYLGLSLWQIDMLKQQKMLLEHQIAMEHIDAEAERQRKNKMFEQLPRSTQLPFQHLITTLFYALIYHSDEGASSIFSAAHIKDKYKLTDRQFQWTAVSAKAFLKQWDAVESLFRSTNFLGKVRMVSVIGFDNVVDVLHRLDAPPSHLKRYIRLVDSRSVRLELAQRTKCHDLVIELLFDDKDLDGLYRYQRLLTPNSPDDFLIREKVRLLTSK